MVIFWVTERLAFGSGITRWKHVEELRALGVTHIINLRHNRHGKKVRQCRNLHLGFIDDKRPRPMWFYRDALRFYRAAKRPRNSKIVTICKHGLCRSASLAYFLLRADGCSPGEAVYIVKKARPRAWICRAYRESGERFLRTKHGLDAPPRKAARIQSHACELLDFLSLRTASQGW